jgi:hypothetical protein
MKKKRTAAHTHYLRGTQLEEGDIAASRAAYESCLAGDCRHLEARINLGRLLHLEGKLREAEKIYRGTEEPELRSFFQFGSFTGGSEARPRGGGGLPSGPSFMTPAWPTPILTSQFCMSVWATPKRLFVTYSLTIV